MPKVLDDDQLRRKKQLEDKRAARKAAKEERDKTNPLTETMVQKDKNNVAAKGLRSPLLELPENPMYDIFSMLPAADLGRLVLTCKQINQMLSEGRITFLMERLNKPNLHIQGIVGYIDMCRTQNEAREIIERSFDGGETGRILPRTKYAKATHNDFVSYARYLDEVISGHNALSTGSKKEPILLPRFVQGRIASVSPEHTLCRVGGDGKKCGAGGSGVASWGVGVRGQLGHGKRENEKLPKRLLELGYKTRIVQVSAGGGLVRVAHSLMLTDTGRVLSFGTGQYGALGHGYSAAKQLPDGLRPRIIEGLNGLRVVAVAAGELHSAVVTCDGDVYTWGDGFCGQLGHGDKRPQVSPRQVRHGLDDEVVASISCGARHTIAVTEDGEVFTWGLGHFGALGRTFTPFDYDADTAVVAFAGEQEAIPPAGLAEALLPVNPPPPPVRDEAAELAAHIDLLANLSLDDSSDQCIPKRVESLQGIEIVGSSAGHRHSLLLSAEGALYSFGTGKHGCLGHGDTQSQMFPVRIATFDEEHVKIMQMSAGVDNSMAVSTTGVCYAWGKSDGGRIGLSTQGNVTYPRRVNVRSPNGTPVKAVDVECGYVHAIVVGLNGTIHMCGGIGLDGAADGQLEGEANEEMGPPRQVPDFNVWHRLHEPKEDGDKKERWQKLGKYEVKGRSKALQEPTSSLR